MSKINMYAIKDTVAEKFSDVFHQPNHAAAVRVFKTTAMTPGNHIHSCPEDFELYLVGHWNDQEGRISPCTPEKLEFVIETPNPDEATPKRYAE